MNKFIKEDYIKIGNVGNIVIDGFHGTIELYTNQNLITFKDCKIKHNDSYVDSPCKLEQFAVYNIDDNFSILVSEYYVYISKYSNSNLLYVPKEQIKIFKYLKTVEQIDEHNFNIDKPEFNNSLGRVSQRFVPLIIMVIITLIISRTQSNSYYMYMSLLMTGSTFVISIIKYIYDLYRFKKQVKKYNKQLNEYNIEYIKQIFKYKLQLISSDNFNYETNEVIFNNRLQNKCINKKMVNYDDEVNVLIGFKKESISNKDSYLKSYNLNINNNVLLLGRYKYELLSSIINKIIYNYKNINLHFIGNFEIFNNLKLLETVTFNGELKFKQNCFNIIITNTNNTINSNGFKVIYVNEKLNNIEFNINTIISSDEHNKIHLELIDNAYVNEYIIADKYVNDIFNIELIKSEQNIIDKIINNDINSIHKVTNLSTNIVQRNWSRNDISSDFTIPIGISNNNIFELNLNQGQDGPHGIICGMTGSGKSELLKTLILSSIIKYNNNQIGFILIDYKGGSFSNYFNEFKHVQGIITNLNNDLERAITILKAELKLRQLILSKYNVSDINELFKYGNILNRTVIVCDEFAELKRDNPDFIKELISISRIGRSLGIHLILCTQKPLGVIDDQIWSNSNFKICLKVNSELDSKEVLKTNDAAYLEKSGDALIKVGEKDIVKFSSTLCDFDSINSEIIDLSSKTKLYSQSKTKKSNITHYFKGDKFREIIKPQLPKKICLNNIVNAHLQLGMLDDIYKQKYSELNFDLKKHHVIAICGVNVTINKAINKLISKQISEQYIKYINKPIKSAQTPLNSGFIIVNDYEIISDELLNEFIFNCYKSNLNIIILCNSFTNIDYKLQSLINCKIQLYSNSRNDYISTLNEYPKNISKNEGRFFVKFDKLYEGQMYYCD